MHVESKITVRFSTMRSEDVGDGGITDQFRYPNSGKNDYNGNKANVPRRVNVNAAITPNIAHKVLAIEV